MRNIVTLPRTRVRNLNADRIHDKDGSREDPAKEPVGTKDIGYLLNAVQNYRSALRNDVSSGPGGIDDCSRAPSVS